MEIIFCLVMVCFVLYMVGVYVAHAGKKKAMNLIVAFYRDLDMHKFTPQDSIDNQFTEEKGYLCNVFITWIVRKNLYATVEGSKAVNLHRKIMQDYVRRHMPEATHTIAFPFGMEGGYNNFRRFQFMRYMWEKYVWKE